MMQAKSQWSPSSREMSSLENVNPGINPRFLSQKMAAKEPEKKMPSTAAKATILSPNRQGKENKGFINLIKLIAASEIHSYSKVHRGCQSTSWPIAPFWPHRALSQWR